MANEELDKSKQLLKDQVTEVGFLDNAFKTLAATISSTLEEAIDNMTGLDDITKKVAKSYQQDITNSIKKSTKGLEDQIALTEKINAGKNVGAEIEAKLSTNSARRQLTLVKIEQLEGISNKQKRKMLETANDVFKAEEKALKGLKVRNDLTQKNKSFLQIAKENAGDLADKIDKSGTLSKVLSGGIGSVLTPMRLLELAVIGVFDAMVKIDKLNGDLAKGLNLSYSEAAALTSELTHAANKSGELKLTGEGLGKALLAVNEITGVYTTENSKNLETLQKIHKASGLTFDQLGGIYSVTQATGGDLKKNTKEFLAQSVLTAQSFGVQINSKKVLADIGKISKATTLSLGGSSAELSKALTTSEALGISMGQMESIADGLLNFEQSISNELEAEMLTGKSLNLEKARSLALNNDIAGAAAEIAKQVGTAAEFGKMNRIQQEALAKATGMNREELAKSLFVQEQLGNSVGKEYDNKKKIINELQAKGLSQEEIKDKLGKESLKTLMHQSSVQENLNKSVAKMKEGFASIAAPLMQIIGPIVDLLIPAVEVLSYLFVPITTALVGMAKLLTLNFDGLTGMQTVLGSIALIWAGIVAQKKISAAISAGEVVLRGIRLAQSKLQNREDLKGLALGKSKLIQLAAQAALWALANPLKALAGLAVAATVGAIAYSYVKGDDVMSPGSNSSGYGSRTLMGPEGAIALNNKDTVIAGTNLFPKGNDVVSGPAGSIQMPDNSEAKRTNALLEALINKPAPKVQMDSIEVGTVAGMSAFSIQ